MSHIALQRKEVPLRTGGVPLFAFFSLANSHVLHVKVPRPRTSPPNTFLPLPLLTLFLHLPFVQGPHSREVQ